MNIKRKWIVKLYRSRRQIVPGKSHRRINFTIKLNRLTYNRFNLAVLGLPDFLIFFWLFLDCKLSIPHSPDQYEMLKTWSLSYDRSPIHKWIASKPGIHKSLEKRRSIEAKNFLVRIFLFGSISAFKICTGFDPFFLVFWSWSKLVRDFP